MHPCLASFPATVIGLQKIDKAVGRKRQLFQKGPKFYDDRGQFLEDYVIGRSEFTIRVVYENRKKGADIRITAMALLKNGNAIVGSYFIEHFPLTQTWAVSTYIGAKDDLMGGHVTAKERDAAKEVARKLGFTAKTRGVSERQALAKISRLIVLISEEEAYAAEARRNRERLARHGW